MSTTDSLTLLGSIEHLNFNVTCDYVNCDEKATHRLICPNCSQFEFMCAAHTQQAQNAKKGSWIVFDKSCKHRVDLYNCIKEPI